MKARLISALFTVLAVSATAACSELKKFEDQTGIKVNLKVIGWPDLLIFGRQHGGQLFDAAGKPTFASDGMVNGVKQYVDLVGKDKVVNPSNVQYKNGPEAPGDFAKGKAAMLMSQNNADNTLQADGMKSTEYGVVGIAQEQAILDKPFTALRWSRAARSTHRQQGRGRYVRDDPCHQVRAPAAGPRRYFANSLVVSPVATAFSVIIAIFAA